MYIKIFYAKMQLYYKNIGGITMGVSYKKLWVLLAQKEMTKADLRKQIDISSATMTKMSRNELVALSVLVKICNELHCDIGEIMEVITETSV